MLTPTLQILLIRKGQRSDGSRPQVLQADLKVLRFEIYVETFKRKAAEVGASP